MIKKIYISGAITGTHDYMQRFALAQKELEAQGYSVINPALVNSNMPADTTYEEYMQMAFTMLDMAGSIYMLQGWEKSKGAKEEHHHALVTGRIIFYQPEKETLVDNDLISRSAFRDKVLEMMKAYDISYQVINELDIFPTAYDVNKVIEQLKETEKCSICTVKHNSIDTCARFCDVGKKLEIVKNGFIEKENV